jgi:UDP-N-acetylglucosamine 2-epimerase (non-hydrolysing)
MKALVVFGTRPEALKLAPVVKALASRMQVRTCVTGQHRQMLDQVLDLFKIVPDHDLDLMRPGQDLFAVTGAILQSLRRVIDEEKPDVIVVQGDTTTTFSAALAAFYLRVPVAHVEAGLRTLDKAQPFPEEVNRRLTSHLADWHFAPTDWARENLLTEGIPADRVFVVGNTGIDALFEVLHRLDEGSVSVLLPASVDEAIKTSQRIILVTGHRRESFGAGFTRMCEAFRCIVERNADVSVVYPVHLNPNVQEPVHEILGGVARIHLTDPVDYPSFVALMRSSELILTDSGGVQEEAPSIGKPVLVMREKTERPEGVRAGVARLVGTSTERIVGETELLLRDRTEYEAMARAQNPYGDGRSADRIAEILSRALV